MPNITETIKQAAIQAVSSSDPVDVLFGTVESTQPLSIRLDPKSVLPAEFFLLTNQVRNHTITMSSDEYTGYAAGGEGEEAFAQHRHAYTGTKTYTVHNALKAGESVLILDRLEAGT